MLMLTNVEHRTTPPGTSHRPSPADILNPLLQEMNRITPGNCQEVKIENECA